MLNTRELKAQMVRKDITQKKLAEEIGISEKTFISRMKKGVFGTDEAKVIIDVLGIENPEKIFFA